MKPFQRGYLDPNQMQRNIEIYYQSWVAGDEEMRKCFPAADENAARAAIISMFHAIRDQEQIWINDKYQVNYRVTEGGPIHLSIKRLDKKVIHDWRDLQEIKNMLVGPEYEAIELYPAESRRVDTANQYHLWVHPVEGFKLPVGWDQGRIVTENSLAGSVQRPFEKEAV